jgi:hypothetical protein
VLVPNSLDHDPFIYASHIAGMTGMYHHTQLFLVEMGVSLTFYWVDLELWSF